MPLITQRILENGDCSVFVLTSITTYLDYSGQVRVSTESAPVLVETEC